MYKRASRYLQHLIEKSNSKKLTSPPQPEISRSIMEAFDSQKLIEGKFEKIVKGGYIFDIDGHDVLPESDKQGNLKTIRCFM